MDHLLNFFKKHQLAFYGPLSVYLGQKVMVHPIFFSAKYQRVVDLRPFEIPFGSALITIGLIMIFVWVKPYIKNK